MASRVALVQGKNRYDNVRHALALISDDLSMAGHQRVLIKPNFVSTRQPLCATHPDAVRAVLDILMEHGVGEVTLAGNPAMGSFREGLRNYGYEPLMERYPLRVVELNADEMIEVEGVDNRLRPKTLMVARTMVESDLRISIGPPKTHDLVQVTLSLKNMAVGSLRVKSASHAGYPGTHLNLARLAPHVHPHLAVIDGFQGMEGNGPISGDAVEWRIAVASTDFVSADALAAHLMGFPPEEIGYLQYCARMGLGVASLGQMVVLGEKPDALERRFRRHPTSKQQEAWHIDDVERYLPPRR